MTLTFSLLIPHVCLSGRRKLQPIRLIPSCWWLRRILVTCWCWSLNGRRPTVGRPPACWRWFPPGGLETRRALTWKFTKSASEPERASRSRCTVPRSLQHHWMLTSVLYRSAAGSDSCLIIFFFRLVFCVKDPEVHTLTQEITFIRCQDSWKKNPKR